MSISVLVSDNIIKSNPMVCVCVCVFQQVGKCVEIGIPHLLLVLIFSQVASPGSISAV